MCNPTTNSSARALTALGILAIIGFTTGCAPDIQSAHEPMHPLSGETVAIRATATGSVGKIELSVAEFQINADASQTAISSLTVVKTCDPLFWVKSLTCIFVMPQSGLDGRLIEFEATAYSPVGATESEKYQFAAGTYPLEGQPVPIRVKGGTLDKLDIVLIRDEGLTPLFFRRYLDDIIEESFFGYASFREWRGLYNFYYSTETGTYHGVIDGSCQFDDPDNMGSLMATGDVVVFLHTGYMGDCKWAGRFSSEVWFDKSLVHESGHALFGLRDEYPSGLGPQCEPPRNVWDEEDDCEAEAQGLGMDPADCVPRGDGRWKIDPEGPTGCIMNGWSTQWQAGSDYGPACLNRVAWRYEKCAAGECMTACPTSTD